MGIEWVYGYRGRDCRSNLHLLSTGEVKCLVVHPNKLLIASGQTAGHNRKEGKAHIRIWNSVSLHTLHVIGLGEFEISISCLAFSKAVIIIHIFLISIVICIPLCSASSSRCFFHLEFDVRSRSQRPLPSEV